MVIFIQLIDNSNSDTCEQIVTPPTLLNELQAEWAPLTDPVFQLTPTSFHVQASVHYEALGSPSISKGTFWEIYSTLLNQFRAIPPNSGFDEAFQLANIAASDEMELMQGVKELRNGDQIVGDHAFVETHAAEFSDSDDLEDDREQRDYAQFTDDEE